MQSRNFLLLALICLLTLVSLTARAQDTSKQNTDSGSAKTATPDQATVRGCLERSRGNYLLIENKTNLVYALRGVGSKLDNQVGREIEVTGSLHGGTIKTGVRPEKQGSNPSDTTHGADGVPLQIEDVNKDVRRIANRCKAADSQ